MLQRRKRFFLLTAILFDGIYYQDRQLIARGRQQLGSLVAENKHSSARKLKQAICLHLLVPLFLHSSIGKYLD